MFLRGQVQPDRGQPRYGLTSSSLATNPIGKQNLTKTDQTLDFFASIQSLAPHAFLLITIESLFADMTHFRLFLGAVLSSNTDRVLPEIGSLASYPFSP